MNRYADFWDIEVERVPMMTGAATVMDASDLQMILDRFDLDLTDKSVIDVGCGTGRLAQLCGRYLGLDITPAMVEYTRQQGLDAHGMEKLDDPELSADVICCFSVFTHIERADRQDYLRKFIQIASFVVVDIVPADEEHGDVAIWYACQKDFEQDVRREGFKVVHSFRHGRIPEDGVDHIYYFLRR